jgi:uncharacterized peroxidase-related enzyme
MTSPTTRPKPRIAALDPDGAPAAARPLLDQIQRETGRLSNLIRVLAHSPAALAAYRALDGALRQGTLDAAMRARIALAVAELERCDYGLSAHIYSARTHAGLDDAEITANRNGASNDPTADAALRFAATLARTHGAIADADLAAFKAAGYDDAQALEIAALVALHTLTSTVNKLARTAIDFPAVTARVAA